MQLENAEKERKLDELEAKIAHLLELLQTVPSANKPNDEIQLRNHFVAYFHYSPQPPTKDDQLDENRKFCCILI